MRCDGSMMPPDPRASAASPPADMGFDDAHFGGGSRATRVGVGGAREKPKKTTVFYSNFSFFYCLGAAAKGC